MRKQIAAANWKMNLTFQQGEKLLDDILTANIKLKEHQQAVFAVPFPYLLMARSEVEEQRNYYVAAQNCYYRKNGAFTGEVSVEMLHSLAVPFCVVGHSERREYFNETNAMLADKVNLCLENFIIPIFCCGEPLAYSRGRDTKSICRNPIKGISFSSSGRENKRHCHCIRTYLGDRYGKNGHYRPGTRNACLFAFYFGQTIWKGCCSKAFLFFTAGV
jgi:triosephosphate isomerase